jgi:hypothetical protein
VEREWLSRWMREIHDLAWIRLGRQLSLESYVLGGIWRVTVHCLLENVLDAGDELEPVYPANWIGCVILGEERCGGLAIQKNNLEE